jgi:broad specificity phosphatase PhoE
MTRRRLYLMRHGEVAYFDADGTPLPEDGVGLTQEGRAQAEAAAALLAPTQIDRVITSGLRRTAETAAIVARGVEAESWSELRELRGAKLATIEDEFVHAFRGVVPLDRRFLGGETIGELFDRVLPAVDRLLAEDGWDTALAVLHGGVNRAIISWALTGERLYLGPLEQSAGCVNVLDVGADGVWIVRAVNHSPFDPAHTETRLTVMERYWKEYRRGQTPEGI